MSRALTFAIAAAILTPIVLAPRALAHDYHVSLTEVEHNVERGFLEVALRLLPEDLERALSLDAGRPVVLDDEAQTDRRIVDYLRERFRVASAVGDRRLDLGWVGKEVDHRAIWLYFEFEVPSTSETWTLENRVLFEIEPGQIQHILFKQGEERTSFTLSAQDDQPITLFSRPAIPLSRPATPSPTEKGGQR